MFKATMTNKLLKSLKNIEYGSLELITPDGRAHKFEGGSSGPNTHIHIRDWDVFTNLSLRGDVALAEDYRDGKWNTPNLQNVLLFGLRNMESLHKFIYGNRFLAAISNVAYKLRMNTLNGSKKNIQEHYDLGNHFYQLWLDPSMTYSSAIFKSEHEELSDAQRNKYDRILDRLGDEPQNILEVGCGWGGFAERAVLTKNHKVKGITLSEEQHDFAKLRLNTLPAEIVLEDYRHQQGLYDAIVSIEMFEAVGEDFWPVYFEKLKSLLKKDGKAVIQTITIDEAHFDRYRKGSDIIRSYIFPGGMLPSKSRFAQEAQKAGLKVTDQYCFGQDYAKTLGIWLEKFDQVQSQLPQHGFDEKFSRLWRFYLASCMAGFETGRTDVMQVELQHA